MSRKILVVDDEISIGEIFRDYFSEEGYVVLLATDAPKALELVSIEHPDLVLLDIKLPGMDGLECLREIKKKLPDTVVVMLTGVQDEEVAKQAIRRGAYEYMTKPMDLQYFEKHILSRVFPA